MTYDIVVVDDDAEIRDIVDFLLSDRGWSVETLADGEECWAHLDARDDGGPDLVVLDIMMPELDGISLLERMRSHDEFETLPVIMLTSRNREEDIVRTLESGADGFIAKPFSEDELVGRIEAVLDS
jgi:DNA-binding response OmpR family regulator